MSEMKITGTLGQDKLLLLKITSLQLVFLIQLIFLFLIGYIRSNNPTETNGPFLAYNSCKKTQTFDSQYLLIASHLIWTGTQAIANH